MNPIENVWNIMKKEIGNQMPCRKEEMWKPVWDVWYSVVPNVLEEPNNLVPRRFTDLNITKGDTRKY